MKHNASGTVIKTFRNSEPRSVFRQEYVKGLPEDVQDRVHRMLVVIDSAETRKDLARLPGDRLKPLKGNRRGEWSIRINDGWRICFVWEDGDAYEVSIEEYH